MKRKVFFDTLKKNKNLFILFAVMTAVNLSVFMLYRIMIEAFFYAEAVIAVFTFAFFFADYIKGLRYTQRLINTKYAVENGNYDLPPTQELSDTQYHEMIELLAKRVNETELLYNEKMRDMSDWYTVWVHQIKTPLAVLKLRLSEGDSEIANDLFRIEEYADMALSYIRLGSEQNDLVIKKYSLDEIIRETLRKYASQFIARKIRLCYTPVNKEVITDKKWLSCIIEQYVSNAVKYTVGGTVTISVEGDTLTVSDTGVGIKPDDLPRIFEKGYTGNNGRTDANSSGLGLYLSKKAAELIGVTLSAESEYGAGSRFSISFPKTEK